MCASWFYLIAPYFATADTLQLLCSLRRYPDITTTTKARAKQIGSSRLLWSERAITLGPDTIHLSAHHHAD